MIEGKAPPILCCLPIFSVSRINLSGEAGEGTGVATQTAKGRVSRVLVPRERWSLQSRGLLPQSVQNVNV